MVRTPAWVIIKDGRSWLVDAKGRGSDLLNESTMWLVFGSAKPNPSPSPMVAGLTF